MGILDGKIAIVTGASRAQGIGSAICTTLAEAGADIFFTCWGDFDKHEGIGFEEGYPEILKRKVESFGVRCVYMEADLSNPQTPIDILDYVEKCLGPASVLVNNATYEKRIDFRSLTAKVLDKHYQVNNSGTIMLSTEFAKRFERSFPNKKGGRIINLISKGPDPENLAYIASKGMLIAITEPLSVGLAPVGITVNSVDPGPTDSGWMDEELKEAFLPYFPAGRIGEPKDAARLIKFLASNDSEWITGQVIKSEGGYVGR